MTKTHNMTGTRPYIIWKNMHRRCRNKNDKAYKNYGKRGIKVCSEWSSFETFWKDMRKRYAEDLFLERIDNNKGYSKENCTWTTREEQNRNKRNNRWYTINGKKYLLKDISKMYGIEYKRLKARIEILGKNIHEAIALGVNKPKYFYFCTRRKKYVVEVTKNNNRIYGGTFTTKKEAILSVKNIIKEHGLQ